MIYPSELNRMFAEIERERQIEERIKAEANRRYPDIVDYYNEGEGANVGEG